MTTLTSQHDAVFGSATGSTFAWRARRADGEVVTGTQVGPDADAVANQLRSDGLIVTAIRPAGLTIDFDQEAEAVRTTAGIRRIKRSDVAVFCQQLGVMLDTGVPLPEALEGHRAAVTQA